MINEDDIKNKDINEISDEQDQDKISDPESFTDIEFIESNEDGDELPAKDIVKKLRTDLKLCRKEKEEYLTGWQRAKADYVNLQKDTDSKIKDIKALVTSNFVEDLLPALDSFDMAMGNREAWEKVDANWRNGIEYIRAQFARVLEDNNVTAINQTGVVFDPNLHESIETIETDDKSKDHTIVDIVQSGYKIGDRIIRPARVKVYTLK